MSQQHTAFTMRRGDEYVVMCRHCGHKRPKELATGELVAMLEIAMQHNASTLVTDAMGKPV
jgi:hypothetical protein